MKIHRTLICCVLIASLFLLPACKTGKTVFTGDPVPPTSDPDQATGKTTATQPSNTPAETTGNESNISQEEKSNLPKELAFNWENSFLQVIDSLGLNDITKAKTVAYEELKDIMTARSLLYDIDNPDGDYQKSLVTATYSKEFYDDHTLIVIPAKAMNAALEITNVQYADGVLKCSVKTWQRPEGEPYIWTPEHFPLGWNFYCFVEIDTVLPEGTQIVCEFTEERLGSAEYRVKLDSFKNKCLFYAYHNTEWA